CRSPHASPTPTTASSTLSLHAPLPPSAVDALVALDEPGPVAEALHLARPVDVDGARVGDVLGKVASALSASPNADTDDADDAGRSEEHTSELQSRENLVCRLLLEKKNT